MRRTQQQRREQTRAALVEAASEVFARRGYQAATVAEIVRAAGCSTGALYAHFPGKAELFLALMDQTIPHWASGYAERLARADDDLDHQLTAVSTRWAALLDDQPQLMLLFIEFWSAAMRDPELRPLFAERHAQIRDALTQLLDQRRGDAGPAGIPTSTLAAIITALGEGFALQRLADRDAVPVELFRTALDLLLATRPTELDAGDRPT